jgi:hypothetical protein
MSEKRTTGLVNGLSGGNCPYPWPFSSSFVGMPATMPLKSAEIQITFFIDDGATLGQC